MKRLFCAVTAFVLLLSLTGCSLTAPEDNSLPARMVAAIDIGVRPYNEAVERHYTGKDTLGPIIRMLRDMDTEDSPEEDPLTDAEQETYTITATYANGEQEVYCILEGQYLRRGAGPWHIIDPARFQEFQRFILDYPSDN